MNSKLILHIDENHPLLIKGLERLGYENHIAYTTPLEDVLKLLPKYSGVVIRSRFPIDKNLISREMLNDDEIDWIDKYHEKVYKNLSGFMQEKELVWLKKSCEPILQ